MTISACSTARGHLAGDLLLKSLAACLLRQFRLEDLCCRTGGDVFAVLLHHIPNDESAHGIASRVCTSIADYGRTAGLSITCSVGAVFVPFSAAPL